MAGWLHCKFQGTCSAEGHTRLLRVHGAVLHCAALAPFAQRLSATFCSRTSHVQAAPRIVLLLEYSLSTAASLAIAAALYHVGWAWAGALPAGVRGALAVALLWLLARQWLRGRPAAGPLFGERAGRVAAALV